MCVDKKASASPASAGFNPYASLLTKLQEDRKETTVSKNALGGGKRDTAHGGSVEGAIAIKTVL